MSWAIRKRFSRSPARFGSLDRAAPYPQHGDHDDGRQHAAHRPGGVDGWDQRGLFHQRAHHLHGEIVQWLAALFGKGVPGNADAQRRIQIARLDTVGDIAPLGSRRG